MGAKDWFICYADGNVPSVLEARRDFDRAGTDALVRRLFASREVVADEDGTLANANPDDDTVYAAVWPGATIVCTSAVALDRPTQLDARFLVEGAGRTVYVHAMHSVVDWFAFGVWGPDGTLQRALSVSGGDEEIIENIGEPLPFERPFLPATSLRPTMRTTTRFRSTRLNSEKQLSTTCSGSCWRATPASRPGRSIRSTSPSPASAWASTPASGDSSAAGDQPRDIRKSVRPARTIPVGPR